MGISNWFESYFSRLFIINIATIRAGQLLGR